MSPAVGCGMVFQDRRPKQSYALAIVNVLLFVLAVSVIGLAFKKWSELRNSGKPSPYPA